MVNSEELAGQASEPHAAIRIRAVDCLAVDAATTAAWARLERVAVEPNAYLSPYFVLPAARHLEPGRAPFVLLAETEDGELAGVGVFTPRGPGTHFPLPHLAAYRSRHSYLTGLLIDQRRVEPVVSAVFDYLCSPGRGWHAVAFTWRSADGPLADAMAATTADRGLPWHETSGSPRAVLVPAKAGGGYLEAELKNGRLKGLRRQTRRLNELGNVDWQAITGRDPSPAAIESFLDLEHRGWKGAEGTSLRSRPEDEAFFREVVEGFGREGRACFTELRLNGVVISSTSNFVSGRAGFAFKIGWDPAYAKLSPGMLNEIEIIRRAPALFGGLDYLDSGASEGSYLDEFWTGRRRLSTGLFPTTALGRRALAFVDTARRLKRRVQRGR